ncbi:MAG: pyridine nucleotide-disulfide oxidoreductase [Actinobacteria bacterium]|nr:MAG: pyridine nucleotide-disulfide oxidoreductase [Actinomycetota bacterium]
MDDLIKVYGASWCPDCRRAKRFLGDQRIPFEWHDIEVDPDGVRTVQERNDGNDIIPTIIFPDGSHLSEPSNEELAEKIGLERTAMMHVYDLIIIGGGPAGLTTSIYAARENLQTLVIDSKGLGGQAGVTERLDNYPGFPEGIGGAELADRIVLQAQRYGVEMLQAVSVKSITSDGEEIDVETATRDHYHSRAALIATGSTYRMTGAPGEGDLIGAGIHFCATCDGPFYRGANQLVVLGGGNSGLEEGLFLTQFVDKVTIVQRADRLTATKLLQDKVMVTPRMEVLLNREVVEFRPKDDGSGKLGAVVLEDRESGATEELHPAGAFVFIGLDPNTGFVKGSVDLDDRGLIVTDMGLQTSMPGVFAAGDVRSGSTKQLASAVGEGAAAAIGIRRYLEALDAKPTHMV